MRKFFLAVFMLAALSGFSQDKVKLSLNEKTGKQEITDVLTVDSVKRDVLYSRALQWIALSYRSAQDVIQLSDKENGKIICKGNWSSNFMLKKGIIEHTLVLDFKDGRFRYRFTDFAYDSSGSGKLDFESRSLGFKKKLFAEAEDNAHSMVLRLFSTLLQELTAGGDDDW